MFTVHAGSEGVLIVGAGLMVMLNGFSPKAVVVSVTRTVKLKVPAADGVPERIPAALRLNPGGHGPGMATKVHV
jgi:hypothetical protein